MEIPVWGSRVNVPDAQMKAGEKGILGCLGLALIVFGLLCLIGTVLTGWSFYGTRNWIKVNATVARNWQTTHTLVLSNGGTSSKHRSQRRQVEHELIAHVEFHYTVKGQEFDGQVYSSFGESSQPEVTHFLDQYPPGSTHTVYYNPAKPEQIALGKASANEPYIVGAIALGTQIFTVVGVILLFIRRRIKVKAGASPGTRKA